MKEDLFLFSFVGLRAREVAMGILSPRKGESRRKRQRTYTRDVIENALTYYSDRGQTKAAEVVQGLMNRLGDRDAINQGALNDREIYIMRFYINRGPVNVATDSAV